MLLFSICVFLWVVCGISALIADWLLSFGEITLNALLVLIMAGSAIGPFALFILLGRFISYDHVVFSLGKTKDKKEN